VSYQTQANLAADQNFQQRLTACTSEQAGAFDDDPDPANASLADRILADATLGLSYFIWPVATAPGFGDAADQEAISDGQLLAAVQALWPTVAAIHPDEP